MSSAREEILQSIRHSLRRTGALEESVRRVLDERLERHEPHLRPAVEGDLAERFMAKLEAVAGTAARVASVMQAPAAIAAYLAEQGAPTDVVLAPDPVLASVPWPESLTIERRVATRDDHVTITNAFAGVAETGSLMLLSSPQSPTSLNFLPDVHVVVLARERIVRHLEDVWALLRAEVPAMPRTVNFITGPSRTADIEQTIQLGAHGPRSLHVILVED